MVTPKEGFVRVSAICIHFTPFTTTKTGKMAQKAIDMNRIRQVQQLRDDGVPIKEIARRTGISRKTVKKYLRKLEVLTGPGNSEAISDKKLAPLVYSNDNTVVRNKRQEALLKHFEQVKGELHKTGVTKQ
jgi:DNA-binding CsgD family transcriptional regulator